MTAAGRARRVRDPPRHPRRAKPALHLGAPKEAGPGQEAYEAKCTQKSAVHVGTMTFDLSAKPDSLKIILPETADWLTLYPCK